MMQHIENSVTKKITTGLLNVANCVDFLMLDEKFIGSQAFISNDVVFEQAMEEVNIENIAEDENGKVVKVNDSKPTNASLPRAIVVSRATVFL